MLLLLEGTQSVHFIHVQLSRGKDIIRQCGIYAVIYD